MALLATQRLAFFLMLCLQQARFSSGWCNYACDTLATNELGHDNNNKEFSLPDPKYIAFYATHSDKLCDAITSQPRMVYSPTYKSLYAVTCESKEEVNMLKLFDKSKTVSTEVGTFDLDGPVVGMTTSMGDTFVQTALTAYIMTANKDTLSLKVTLKASSLKPGTSFQGRVSTGSAFHSFFLENTEASEAFIYKLPISGDANSATITELPPNTLDYHLIDGKDNIFYCSNKNIVQLGNKNRLSQISLDSTCSSLILPEIGRLILATNQETTSQLLEIYTTTFTHTTLLKNIPSPISGMSRSAATTKNGQEGRIAVTVATGVLMVDDSAVKRRDAIGEVETVMEVVMTPGREILQAPVSIADLGNPFFTVLNTDETTRGVRESFPTGMVDSKLSTFFPSTKKGISEPQMSTSPLGINYQILAVSDDGTVVTYERCVRYADGEEVPKQACPYPDLASEWDLPVGVVIVAAGASLVFVPGGMYTMKKMKCNSSEDDEDDYSSDEDEDED